MIAQSSGLNYKITPMFQPVVPPAEPAPVTTTPFDTPAPPDAEIANVDDLTSNYYNSYSQLKDFTTTMWQDYGLDVTKPDLTQPGGGKFYQAYLNMDANVRMAGQDLKQQRKFAEEAFTSQLKGESLRAVGFDPTKQLYSQYEKAGAVPTKLLPEVEDVLKTIAGHVYKTPAEVEFANKNVILPLIQTLISNKNADPYNADMYQRNIDALHSATFERQQFAPSGGGEGETGETKVKTLYIEPALDAKGLVDFDRVTYQTIKTPSGNQKVAMWEPNTDRIRGKKENMLAGREISKTVDFYYMTPSKQVFVRYQTPWDEPTNDERVDNLSPKDEILQDLKYNTRQQTEEEAYTYMTKKRIGDTQESLFEGNKEKKNQLEEDQARILKKLGETETNYNELDAFWKGEDSELKGNNPVLKTSFGNIMFSSNWWDEPRTYELKNPDILEGTGIPIPKNKKEMTSQDINDLIIKLGTRVIEIKRKDKTWKKSEKATTAQISTPNQNVAQTNSGIDWLA